MTDREKAIVMAYTGIAMLTGEKINEFYKYLAELYGRPVYTHEIVTLDIAEKAKLDFIRLCEETPDKRTETHTCDCERKETHGDVIYRDEAIDAVAEGLKRIFVEYGEVAEQLINKVPSAEPEIIRCRECKFWTHIKRTNRYWCKTDDGLYDLNPSPDDFCSRAERRTE